MDKNNLLWNNQLPVEERLDFLIREMTLDEKLHCLTTGCPDIERLGIRASHVGGEAAHGIQARHDQAFDAGSAEPTTSFTQPIGMSGSFDEELIRERAHFIRETTEEVSAAGRLRLIWSVIRAGDGQRRLTEKIPA